MNPTNSPLNLRNIEDDNSQIKINGEILNSKKFEISKILLEDQNLIQLTINKSVLNINKREIKRYCLEIRLKFSDHAPVYFYKNSSMEAHSSDTSTIFNQRKIPSIIPRLINFIIWILNFIVITRNFKLLLRSFKRAWIYILLPCKYPRNFALYLSNFANMNLEEITFSPKSCQTNQEYPCKYTENNRFLVVSSSMDLNFMMMFLIIGAIGSFCMNLTGRERNTLAKNLTFIFFWIKVSLEFNNFTSSCTKIIYVGLTQKPSMKLVFVACFMSVIIFGLLFTNDYYKKIGFHAYKVPFSKTVRFKKKLVEYAKEKNFMKKKGKKLIKTTKLVYDEEMSKKSRVRRAKKTPLKSILKLKTVPSDKRVLITIELFKRLAFAVDYDNFKIVPFNFLNNLKALFSILLIIILKNYPILCCTCFFLTQFLITWVWLRKNEGLMQNSFKTKITHELISDSIFDIALCGLVIFPSLGYSYQYGIFLQIYHSSLIVIKIGFFFYGLAIEIKRLKSRSKIVGGLNKREYHERMEFGVIKQKIKDGDKRVRYFQGFDEEEEEKEKSSKFSSLKDYDYERAQFKLTGTISKVTPLRQRKKMRRREREVERIVAKVDNKFKKRLERHDEESEGEKCEKKKISIVNTKMVRKGSMKNRKIQHLNRVKRMMMKDPEVMEVYGNLKNDDEKFRFIYEFI